MFVTEATQQVGVLGIVRNAANDGTIMFPLFKESNKQELVHGYSNELRPLTPSMLEMVSGAIDPGDICPVAAMRREMGEERGIKDISLFGPLQSTLEVTQQRDDTFIDFSVVMFLISLTPSQQEALSHHELTRKYKEYSDKHLVESLNMMSEEPFRPLAWAALRVAVRNNFWKQQ